MAFGVTQTVSCMVGAHENAKQWNVHVHVHDMSIKDDAFTFSHQAMCYLRQSVTHLPPTVHLDKEGWMGSYICN